jgi:hypothetical protein
MDIQFAYNIERLLYFNCNYNTAVVKRYVDHSGQYPYK